MVAQEKANNKRKTSNQPTVAAVECAIAKQQPKGFRLVSSKTINSGRIRIFSMWNCFVSFDIYFSFVSFSLSQLMIVTVGRGMRRWREKEGADECTREGERRCKKKMMIYSMRVQGLQEDEDEEEGV